LEAYPRGTGSSYIRAGSAAVLPACATFAAMPTVPIDEGPRDRRRVGPFWIEEGNGLLVVGAVILIAFAVLYTLAVLNRPH